MEQVKSLMKSDHNNKKKASNIVPNLFREKNLFLMIFSLRISLFQPSFLYIFFYIKLSLNCLSCLSSGCAPLSLRVWCTVRVCAVYLTTFRHLCSISLRTSDFGLLQLALTLGAEMQMKKKTRPVFKLRRIRWDK